MPLPACYSVLAAGLIWFGIKSRKIVSHLSTGTLVMGTRALHLGCG